MRFIAALFIGLAASSAFGQGIVTQFNFNGGTGTTTPNIGTGTASQIGGTTATFAGGLSDGGSSDGSAATNFGWNLTAYPAASVGSGTAGSQFSISTVGQSNLVFRFDQRFSNTASRFHRVEYTTDGTNWTSAGTVSAAFLVSNTTWYNNRTFDLSGIAAANNNANFGVRVVSIFDPANNTSYTAAATGSTYGTGGTVRFDNVTLSSGHVWQGGVDTAFSTAGNFTGGLAASSSSTVLLGTAGGANTTLATAGAGTILEQLIFQSGAPSYTISGAGTLGLTAGIVNNATNTQTISAPVTFGQSNSIQNTGTLNISGAMNFTNFLSLTGGVTNFNSTGTGAISAITTGNPTVATVRVAPGATLGGTGNISTTASVALFANGRIRGGNGSTATGNPTLTTGAISFANTSRLQVVVGGPAATSVNSKIISTGAFNPTAIATDVMTIDLTNDGTLVQGESYSIIVATFASTTATSANFTLNPTNFAFSGTPVVTVNATNVVVNFVPVPEPTTVLGLSALGIFAVRRIRRLYNS